MLLRPTARPGPARPAALALVLALTALLLYAAPGTAPASATAAHAKLVSISPKDGETVKEPPPRVLLTFNENVLGEFSVVKVADASGALVSVGDPQVQGREVSQPLQAGLPQGGYTVTFRVVSADSHPVSGRSTFTIAQSATPPPASNTGAPSSAASSPGSAASTVDGSSSPPATSANSAPESVAATGTPSIAASPAGGAEEDPGSALPWLVGGVVALLALAGLGAWFVRSRRSGRHA